MGKRRRAVKIMLRPGQQKLALDKFTDRCTIIHNARRGSCEMEETIEIADVDLADPADCVGEDVPAPQRGSQAFAQHSSGLYRWDEVFDEWGVQAVTWDGSGEFC